MANEGKAVAVAGVGFLLVWSSVNNAGILASVRDMIAGKQPTPGAGQVTVGQTATGSTSGSSSSSSESTGGNNPSSGTTNAQNQALGKQMAAAYGWDSGAEWVALNNIVMQESGWSDTVVNSTSTASGIAQNINGWSSNYQDGNAPQQIAWLLQYIQQRYGDPIAAWSFHLAHGWY